MKKSKEQTRQEIIAKIRTMLKEHGLNPDSIEIDLVKKKQEGYKHGK